MNRPCARVHLGKWRASFGRCRLYRMIANWTDYQQDLCRILTYCSGLACSLRALPRLQCCTRHSWITAGIIDRPHWRIFISGDCGRIILIYVFTIAVGTFDPALRLRYLQPDPGMAQRIITTIAGKALFICRLCFWHLCWHRSALLVGCARQRTPVRAAVA